MVVVMLDMGVAKVHRIPEGLQVMAPAEDLRADQAIARDASLVSFGEGAIEGLDVFAHHAIGGEVRRQLRHARPDYAGPLLGHATVVALIETRNDLVLQEVIDL